LAKEKLKKIQEIVKKIQGDKSLTRTRLCVIINKVKEGKLVAADQKRLCTQTFIAGIAAEVENDRQEIRSGSRGDGQTVSPTLNKDLKLSKKSARWWRKLKDKDMKKEQV
jgi:hypothetical protein